MVDFDARIAAVLSADVAAHATLERDSPPQAARAVGQLKDALTTLAAQHNGSMAAAFGSIFRATFASAADAVACAVALQDSIDERNKGLPGGDQVDTRAGVALGTIAQREDVLSGQGVDQADGLRQLGEAGAVFEQARAAAAATFAAEGVRSVAGGDLSVYVLDPARAARQQEKRQWQSRWEQHQHAWGKHRERHYDRMRRRFDRQAEPGTFRRERTGPPRSPAERAEYELKNIKRLNRNALYGALTIVFLFLLNGDDRARAAVVPVAGARHPCGAGAAGRPHAGARFRRRWHAGHSAALGGLVLRAPRVGFAVRCRVGRPRPPPGRRRAHHPLARGRAAPLSAARDDLRGLDRRAVRREPADEPG